MPLLNSVFGTNYSAINFPITGNNRKFSEELRLSGEHTGPFDWILGAFYTKEHNPSNGDTSIYAPNSQQIEPFFAGGVAAPLDLFNVAVDSTFKEKAAFGNLTWHLTPRLEITGGIRYARDTEGSTQYGTEFGASAAIPLVMGSESAWTYLADIRYRLNPNAIVYARYATGYRPGGPNAQAFDPVTHQPLGPATYSSDTLKSYEAGYKANTADHRFGIDLALYDIEWTGLQLTEVIQTREGGFGFGTNVPGGVTMRGAELALNANPFPGFTISGAFAYERTKLNQDEPVLGGVKGERVPNVPRFTASLDANYQISNDRLRPTIGASLRHVSSRETTFNANPNEPQYELPAYTIIDARASITLPSVNVQFFIRNLLDNKRAQISNVYPQFGNRIAIAQPRTFGVNLTKKFGGGS